MDSRRPIIRPLIRSTAALWLLGAAAAAAQQQTAPVLLSPDEAFRLEAVRTAPQRVRLSWTIAPGYYLYRDRFRFRDARGAPLSALTFPRGLPKQDPYFGPTEIFRDRVIIELALGTAGEASSASLRVTSQGCADAGVCFPPQTAQLDLTTGARIVVPAGDPVADSVMPAATDADPLSALADPPASGRIGALPFIRVRDSAALDALLLDARRRHAPTMLDFYADWCIPCRRMEARTLSAPVVGDALGNTLLLRVDLSAHTRADALLLARFGLEGPPAVLFFDRDGAEATRRIVGFLAPEAFAARARDASR